VRGAPAPVRGTPPGLALDGAPRAARAVVLAPVTARGWGARAHADVLALLDDVLRAHACADPARVVLTGISMGGAGAWALGAAACARFAGVSPVCGYGEPAAAAALARTPLWVAHGANDAVIPADESAAMVEAARRAGARDVVHRVLDGRAPEGAPDMVGHDSWTETYADEGWWDWVEALPPRPQEGVAAGRS